VISGFTFATDVVIVSEGMETSNLHNLTIGTVPVDGSVSVFQAWQPGQIISQEYKILRLLGCGGMGEVYLAEHDVPTQHTLYAVKILRSQYTKTQVKGFLQELRTWMRLPEHPNITACNFFRSHGTRLMIFSEYVSGGSLLDWIQNGRISSLEQAIKIAVDCARGLAVAHRNGVIHQDVKPANILMDDNGTAKLTDFGLAAAGHSRHPGHSLSMKSDPVLVTVQGLTPVYCSPEQLSGEKVGPGADIWSFGLTLLHMLQGKITWPLGIMAQEILRDLSEKNFHDFVLPVPPCLEKILVICFRLNPEDRWPSAEKLAKALFELCGDIVTPGYSPVIHSEKIVENDPVCEQKEGLFAWDNPIKFIETIQARDESFVLSGERDSDSTPRAQAMTDLVNLESVLEWVADHRRKHPEQYDRLCVDAMINKGHILLYLNDPQGAVTAFESAVDACEEVLQQSGDVSILSRLLDSYSNLLFSLNRYGRLEEATRMGNRADRVIEAFATTGTGTKKDVLTICQYYLNSGLTLAKSSRNQQAVRQFDKAMVILTETPDYETDTDRNTVYLNILSNKANTCKAMGDIQTARTLYETVKSSQERQYRKTGSLHTLRNLGTVYINLGEMLGHLGKYSEETALYCHATELLEQEAGSGIQSNLAEQLVSIKINHALAFMNMSRYQEALKIIESGHKICSQYVQKEGRTDFLPKLGLILMNKAVMLAHLDDYPKARDTLEKSVTLYEHLVQGNWPDLVRYLGIACMNLAEILTRQAQYDDALKRFDQAVTLTGRKSSDIPYFSRGDIGNILVHKAETLMRMNRIDEARETVRKGLALLNSEYKKTGFVQFKNHQEWAEMTLKDIL
jgi:serine/threonine protein kinase